MPSWKKLITSGSSANLNHVTASGNISGKKLIITGDISASGNLYAEGDLVLGDLGTTNAIYVSASNGNAILSGDAGSTGDVSFEIRNSDTNTSISQTSTLKFGHGGPYNGGKIVSGRDGVYYGGFDTTRDSNLQFYTALNDTDTEYMRITSAGNVGIGTASPTTTLDVSGSLRSYSLTIQSEADTSCSINFTQANNFFIDLQHDSALSASHDSVCVGQSGVIAVRQDGTGGRDLTLPSTWKTPRGASITWNDDPNDMNLISYYIVSSSFVAINYMGDFS